MFFCLNTKRTQSNSEKTSIWSTLKLLRKKVWFSFSFFLFDCLITLIGYCVPNLVILPHFEDRKEMHGSYRACFPFFPTFQRFSWFPVFFPVFYCLSCLFVCLFFQVFSSIWIFRYFPTQGSYRSWKTWKTLKNQPILSKSGKSQICFILKAVRIYFLSFLRMIFFLVYFLAYFLYVYLIE